MQELIEQLRQEKPSSVEELTQFINYTYITAEQLTVLWGHYVGNCMTLGCKSSRICIWDAKTYICRRTCNWGTLCTVRLDGEIRTNRLYRKSGNICSVLLFLVLSGASMLPQALNLALQNKNN